MPRFRIPLSAMWVRMFSTAQMEGGLASGKWYWPVGVMEDVLFCLLLKGRTDPGFPRPILHEISMSLEFKRPGSGSQEAILERR